MNRYYEDHSYCAEHETVVTDCFRENDRIYIRLEETIFFPEEGGQHADTGGLFWDPLPEREGYERSARVLGGEVRKGEIRYLVDTEVPVGTRVLCWINWTDRFSRMQQHTGEHILTGVIHHRFGYDNVGFHLSDDSLVTLDLNGPLTEEEIQKMETAANQVVWKDLPVTALYPSHEELAHLKYRSKIEIEGQVRLIRIGTEENSVDLCACCAPHCARTGEVGIIKIITAQNYKGGVRLGILCGERALMHYRREWDRLTGIARSLSTGVDHVAQSVNQLRDELTAANEKNARLTEQILSSEIGQLPKSGNGLIFSGEALPNAVLKHCYAALTEHVSGCAGIFMGNDQDGYRYAAGGFGDARKLAERMRSGLGARGGGSPEMIQGKTAASREEIQTFWAAL